jgi:predicted phage terminase large subunit-like protein
MFKDKYWKHYDLLPPDVSLIRIYADTAQKTEERHDYSVFQCWAYSPSQGIFLVDQIRGKWEAPELYEQAKLFWNKHRPTIFKPLGASCMKIEDKSSGSSLIQTLLKDELIPVEGIQRNRDKVFRAMGVVKYFASGYVHIPANRDWLSDYKDEFSKFSAMNTHRHDDQIDPTMDAVEDLLVFTGATYSQASLGR